MDWTWRLGFIRVSIGQISLHKCHVFLFVYMPTRHQACTWTGWRRSSASPWAPSYSRLGKLHTWKRWLTVFYSSAYRTELSGAVSKCTDCESLGLHGGVAEASVFRDMTRLYTLGYWVLRNRRFVWSKSAASA